MLSREPGQTPLDDISGLKVEARTKAELDAYEYRNYAKANKKYRLLKLSDKTAPFDKEWLQEVHRDMLGDVWEWAGSIRRTEKTIGLKDWYKIVPEMERLTFEIPQWEKEKRPTVDVAVQIHYRLAWIHPFENGNGRWARLVTNIYLRKNGIPFIEWPTDLNVVNKSFRPQYMESLKAADKGEFGPLTKLHRKYGAFS